MDGSGSIGADNFQRVKDFLKLIVDSVDVGPTRTRIGVVQFNSQAFTEMSLSEFTDASSVKRKHLEDVELPGSLLFDV